MKKILFFVLILGLSFALFTFGQEENKIKVEIRVPSFSESKLGKEFKELDDFVRKNISRRSSSEFFMLLPNKKAVGQGRVESFDSEKLVLNSNGFKTTWIVRTDTTFLGSKNLRKLAQATSTPISTTSLKVNQKVKILGVWDGQNLLAKRIISLEPVRSEQVNLKEQQLNKLIEKLQEALQRSDVQNDLILMKKFLEQAPLEETQLNKLVERLQEDLQRVDVQNDLILMKKILEFLGNREVCVQVIPPLKVKEQQLNELIEILQEDLKRENVGIYLREFSGNKQVCIAAITSL